MAMLDEEYGVIKEKDSRDKNAYFTGRMHSHHVVIAGLAAGVDGIASAAQVAHDMLWTFKNVKVGLLVGIGGGIPHLDAHEQFLPQLGDVVVSQPSKLNGGVVQWDYGKYMENGEFRQKGVLDKPPPVLLNALQLLQAIHMRKSSKMKQYIQRAFEENPLMADMGFLPPTVDSVKQLGEMVAPKQHYGTIASGSGVVADSKLRDLIRDQCGAKCVEMEAAGLMDHFKCLVIRGICDLADGEKNDDWQKYAAMTAAAFARELLSFVSVEEMKATDQIRQALDAIAAHQVALSEHVIQNAAQERQMFCGMFRICRYEDHKERNPEQVADTCTWILKDPQFLKWSHDSQHDILWFTSDPGCGKSVLSKYLVNSAMRAIGFEVICYFFFKDDDRQNSLVLALCSMIHQLFRQRPKLIELARSMVDLDTRPEDLGIEALWRLFESLCGDKEVGKVACICDGLDECIESDRKLLTAKVAGYLSKSQSRLESAHSGFTKFLFTSRPYQQIKGDILRLKAICPEVHLQGEAMDNIIRDDVDRVVRAEVARIVDEVQLSQEVGATLQKQLLDLKSRTFLHIQLASGFIQKLLEECLDPETLTISLLPESLEKAYNDILARVSASKRETVVKILMLIVGTKRALTARELALLYAMDDQSRPTSFKHMRVNQQHFERQLRGWCALFVYQDNRQNIHLIHQTAKDFLVRRVAEITEHGDYWRHSMTVTQVENLAARTCANFLKLTDMDDLYQVALAEKAYAHRYMLEGVAMNIANLGQKASRPSAGSLIADEDAAVSLLIYSSRYWAEHARAAGLSTSDELVETLMPLYDNTKESYLSHTRLFWMQKYWNENWPKFEPLQLALFNGHIALVQHLSTGPTLELDAVDTCGRTILSWTAELGYAEELNWLLARGADMNFESPRRGTVLQAAAAGGHEHVVRLLLKNGRDIDVNLVGGPYGSALHAACTMGHEQVVQLLLQSGCSIDLKIQALTTPLSCAAVNGHYSIVMLLLNAGADSNARDKGNSPPCIAAAEGGNLQCLEAILDWHKTQLTASDFESLWYCTWNQPAMMKLVLEKIYPTTSQRETMNKAVGQSQLNAPAPRFLDVFGARNVEHLEMVRGSYQNQKHSDPNIILMLDTAIKQSSSRNTQSKSLNDNVHEFEQLRLQTRASAREFQSAQIQWNPLLNMSLMAKQQ